MDWAVGGIDMSMTKYAGTECMEYLNPTWKIIETILILVTCMYSIYWSYPQCTLPNRPYKEKVSSGKKKLLALICLCFGMEIAFKSATKTGIYLLNPCHIITVMQIYLLTAAPSKTVTTVFRMHLNYLNGPILALVFYETETRLLPLEAAVYWIQHLLILVVPYYLLRIGGVYNTENAKEVHWNVMAYSVFIIYNFTILQAVSAATNVNLNHAMCPIEADPFRSQLYRTATFLHQALIGPIVGKTYVYITDYFLTKFKYTRVKVILNEYDNYKISHSE
ncbi:unnamed protein product [Ceutorhynchus assimilis]|uniref:Transmembrane protein 164 n=1 Tax=Ceutorhynchus assimilis TaxID=467358 RepID=A0A9N9MMX2_9CUCU|nr:unnamed protein product [Ceutorhynchus assimilis]